MEEVLFNIKGGLGNQFFQTAFALCLEQSCQLKPKFLINSYKNYSYGFSYELNTNEFGIVDKYKILTESDREDYRVLQEPDNLNYQNLEQIFDAIKSTLNHERPLLIDGYWANEGFFESHEDLIRSALKPRLREHELVNEPFIAAHVRRYEYGHNGLPMIAYYKLAVQSIRREKGDLKVKVFTDEPNFCQFVFKDLKNIEIVKPNIYSPISDFKHMLEAEHWVLANSSFGYWAAFFGEKNDSIVYFPHPFCSWLSHTILHQRLVRWRVVDDVVRAP